jgi:hypothetical protein
MVKFNIVKPKAINNEHKINIKIESPEECIIKYGINVFGGVIDEYDSKNLLTLVRFFGMGEMTPGMLLSYVSGFVTMAMQLSLENGLPTEIIRQVAMVAIEEGLNGKNIGVREI